MNNPPPALDPAHLERLERLTRDYARHASGCGGLGTALGGLFVALLLVGDLAGHHFTLHLWGAFAPLGILGLLPLAALPFLWLGARWALRAWWYERHGRVLAGPARPRRAWVGILVAGAWWACAILLLEMGAARHKGARAALITLLMGAFLLALGRLRLGRLERVLSAFLFAVPAFLLAGVQLPAGDLLVSLPLMALAALVLGLREHAAFRRVERDLEALA
jgi:hypothetical protein